MGAIWALLKDVTHGSARISSRVVECALLVASHYWCLGSFVVRQCHAPRYPRDSLVSYVHGNNRAYLGIECLKSPVHKHLGQLVQSEYVANEYLTP